MLNKKEFENKVEKIFSVNKEAIKTSSDEERSCFIEERVERLLRLYPGEAAAYAGMVGYDGTYLKQVYSDSFRRMFSAGLDLSDQGIVGRRMEYFRDVGRIPMIKAKYFGVERYLLFRLNFLPQAVEKFVLYEGSHSSLVDGHKILESDGVGALYGVFCVEGIFDGKCLDLVNESLSENADDLEARARNSQLESLDDFNFFHMTDEMLDCYLSMMDREAKQPLNNTVLKGFKRNFYQATWKEFPRIPMAGLEGYDKVDSLTTLGIFDFSPPDWPTYISLDESMSLSRFMQQSKGTTDVYGLVINGEKLLKARNVFIDPEVAEVCELGFNFLVGGGIPGAAIEEIRLLKKTDILIRDVLR